MRSAIVVLPVCASLAAGALLGFSLRSRPAARPLVVVAPVPIAVTSPPRRPHTPAKYEHPIGGQYLESNLLLAYPDMPPMLLEPHTGPDAFRYGWRYSTLVTAMAKELAAVIDDACPDGCDSAREARDALQTWLDIYPQTETHALKQWTSDDDVAPTYFRRLTVRTSAGAIAVDVACTATADYLGMRGWNDGVTCDATVRDHGRVLATYQPRQLTVLDHHTWVHPIDAWEQTVTFASGAFVTKSGWDYEGDPDMPALVKTRAGGGVSWTADRK